MNAIMDELEEGLRHPRPGTAAANAKEFGIDLTLVIEQLRRTPDERLRQLDSFLESVRVIQRSTGNHPPNEAK